MNSPTDRARVGRSLLPDLATLPLHLVAQHVRDDPTLYGFHGWERAMIVIAAMQEGLQWTTRDLREVLLEGRRHGEIALRSPMLNPFIDPLGLPDAWDDPEWFSAQPQPNGIAALDAWLQSFAHHTPARCESVTEQVAFATVVMAMLEQAMGPSRDWEVLAVEGRPLKAALCCGYDARLVISPSMAVLFSEGMYCG
jgi:hypothetical protein